MKYLITLFFFFSLISCDESKEKSEKMADVIYTNAKIYTMDSNNSWAEALAVKDSKIIAIGSSAEIGKIARKDTQIIDLGGKFVIPDNSSAFEFNHIA